MIKIRELRKTYAGKDVLYIDHLEIRKGDCIGLVGNNGAGKTTLFSLILDLIPASSGAVYHKDMLATESHEWKSWTGSYLDENFIIGYLFPEEYFYFVGNLRGVKKEEVDQLLEKYTSFFNGEILKKNTYIRDMSKGNQKKVGIIATLIGNPELIIWDEPFANLDPSTQIRLKQVIRDLSADGTKTLLISSHDILHTVDVSSRIIALQKGQLVKDMETSPKTLIELEAFFSA
ncbi:ATP-binding cassette domain-containing protein [Sphingobacterium corticis]|uniref:ATP-binding cassette domain-containing protein n=1 Tax=Sphingobacterium corticis TaxID=1812823 RepID=A0ABW5NK90_9SPHI